MTKEQYEHVSAGGVVYDFLQLDRARRDVAKRRAKPEQRRQVEMASPAQLEMARNYARVRRADQRVAVQEIRQYGGSARQWYAAVRPDLSIPAAATESGQREHRSPSSTRRRTAKSASGSDDPGEPSSTAYRVRLRREARSVHSYIAESLSVDGGVITASARRRSAWASGIEWGPLKLYHWPAREVLVAEEVS